MLNKEVTPSAKISRKENEVENENQTDLKKSSFDPIERIKRGFEFFKSTDYDKRPDYYHQLAEKQEPKFLMFGCSDSRVAPTNILNLAPGEAFMVRNIANLVPTFNKNRYSDIGAVIEYAVLYLKVEVIMVIGHSRCGGIKRMISLPDKKTYYDFIDDWVSIALPAKNKVITDHPHVSGEQLETLVEKESVMKSLVNLLSYPYVRSGVDKKELKLLGGYYDFVHGKFDILGDKPTIDIYTH